MDVDTVQSVMVGTVRTRPDLARAISSDGTPHSLNVQHVTHRFGSVVAIDDVSLGVAPGEFLALLGPSGCGKTTLLRAIAGFVRPTEGEVLIDDEPVTDVPTRWRGVGIVFQSYALFPHLSVEENIAYGLKARAATRADIARNVQAMLDLVRLSPMRSRYPRQLSGGQQQRVAVARALAVRPRILLLDEPFSALDRGLRLDMQIEIKRIQKELGITTVLVTHDQDEAMSMADRIAVMNQGRLCQLGAPMDVYDRPADAFVNSFIGSTNLLPAQVKTIDGAIARLRIDTSGILLAVAIERQIDIGDQVMLSVRPERWRIHREPGPHRFRGSVALAMPLGSSILYEIDIGLAQLVKVRIGRDRGEPLFGIGESVFLAVDRPDTCPVFPQSEVPEQSDKFLNGAPLSANNGERLTPH